MDFMYRLLAEDVWPLVGVCAVAALLLVIATVASGRARYLMMAGGLAIVSALLILLEALWVTDRERVDRTIDELAGAVRRNDSAAIAQRLAPHCRFGNLDREGIQRLTDGLLRTIEIQKLTISSRKTQVSSLRGEATAEFLAVARGRESNTEFNPYPTRWRLRLTQDASGAWLVFDIQEIGDRLQGTAEGR